MTIDEAIDAVKIVLEAEANHSWGLTSLLHREWCPAVDKALTALKVIEEYVANSNNTAFDQVDKFGLPEAP